jgi:serpin B
MCKLLAGLLTLAILAADTVTSAGDRPAPAGTRILVEGNNVFAFDLYGKLRAREGNLFLSPLSISSSLALTYAGARGDTAAEMARVLHFSGGPEQISPAFAALLKNLYGDEPRGYQLRIANALWGQKDSGFLPHFLHVTRECSGAGLRPVDFTRHPDATRLAINRWVEETTRGRIKDLLPSGSVTGDTRLVLTNAIYFKGAWAHPFEMDLTREKAFFLGSGRKVRTTLMHDTGDYGYLDAGTFQALELPYEGKGLSLVVLLPKQADGLADLEQSLSAANLEGWRSAMRQEKVIVGLPRFKVTAEFKLNEALSELGMPLAFGTEADFSGMNGRRDLLLSGAVHKAFVEVSEEGTEAAGASGVNVELIALSPRAKPRFIADHPFVFLVRDNRSGSILFLGRLVNPAER